MLLGPSRTTPSEICVGHPTWSSFPCLGLQYFLNQDEGWEDSWSGTLRVTITVPSLPRWQLSGGYRQASWRAPKGQRCVSLFVGQSNCSLATLRLTFSDC